jgi:hypothetical protein
VHTHIANHSRRFINHHLTTATYWASWPEFETLYNKMNIQLWRQRWQWFGIPLWCRASDSVILEGPSFHGPHVTQSPVDPHPFPIQNTMLYIHMDSTTLKMEAACTSETSATLHTSTWCNNPRRGSTDRKKLATDPVHTGPATISQRFSKTST